jgi:hypothetical protein
LPPQDVKAHESPCWTRWRRVGAFVVAAGVVDAVVAAIEFL